MLHTSSCQIMVQKSAIVFGFGPFEDKITIDKDLKYNENGRTVNEKGRFFHRLPWVAMYVRLPLVS